MTIQCLDKQVFNLWILEYDESLEYDQHIYQCIICMDRFTDPVIGSDGMVYCESCIIEWNKKTNQVRKYKPIAMLWQQRLPI